MLRLFRPVANFRAARIAARNARKPYQGQPITVQRVRFFPARNIVRSAAIGGCIAYLCYHLYDTTVISPLLRYLDKEYASLSSKEKKELDEELDDFDDSIFLPFPFTTAEVQSSPYRGSDPEWAQFGQISKDKQLQTRIRNELADKVKHVLWDEDGLHWTAEPVDSLTVFRLRKILWPTAMAQSSWAFTSAMAKQHWSEFQRMLGFETPPPPSPFSRPRTTLDHPKIASAGRQTPDGIPADTPSGPGNKSTELQQPSDAPSGGKTNFLKDAALSHAGDVRQMSSGPWVEFVKKLSQTWKPTRNYPPRGSIIVSGFVEIETSKGFIVVDVSSYWNPKTKKFDSRSLFMNVRRIQMKVQSPARR
ncbi:hypothetical protein ACHAQA_004772 [Verticillium albo-atrum]